MTSVYPYSSDLGLCHNKVERSLAYAGISLLLFYIDDSILMESDGEKLISLQNAIVKIQLNLAKFQGFATSGKFPWCFLSIENISEYPL